MTLVQVLPVGVPDGTLYLCLRWGRQWGQAFREPPTADIILPASC